jgi:hypothetical protein
MLFLIPYSQKLLSLAIYEESKLRTHSFQETLAGNINNKIDYPDDRTVQVPSHKKNVSRMEATTTTTTKNHALQLSKIRLHILNDILRPTLMSTERWGPDVEDSWRYHIRLVAWLRKEWLLAAHGPYIQQAMMAYPSMRTSPQLQPSKRRRFVMDLLHRGIINLNHDNDVESNAAINRNNNNITTSSKDDLDTFRRLPRSNVVVKALGMTRWSPEKNSHMIRQAILPLVEKLGGTTVSVANSSNFGKGQISDKTTNHDGGNNNFGGNHAIIPSDANLADTSLEDILDCVTGGHVKNCGPLNALCQEANCYQLWTREYVEHLGDYLLQRTQSWHPGHSIVLDVGAGDGLLVQCLKEYMHNRVEKRVLSHSGTRRGSIKEIDSVSSHRMRIPTLIATDDMSWNIHSKANVERLSLKDSLHKYASSTRSAGQASIESPTCRAHVIVLCSWMPMGEDWTAMFRDAGVDEYILIGESDDGSCGHNWWTWGNAAFRDSTVEAVSSRSEKSIVPPYVQDGYRRWDMDTLTPYQFSSFDCAVSKSSKTVSFRRAIPAD